VIITSFIRAALQLSILLMPLYSVAQETTSAIERQAADFLYQHYSEHFPDAQIKINISPLKSQFKQHVCTDKLTFTPPRNISSRPLLKVSCTRPRSWSLFVRGSASVFTNAFIARTRLKKGQRLEASMLDIKRIDAIKHRDSFNSSDQLAGMVVKRSIIAGKVITARDIKQAPAISKGDAIIIEAKRGGLSIRTTGVAEESGYIGDQIRARNDRSGKQVRGRISARGLIIVP